MNTVTWAPLHLNVHVAVIENMFGLKVVPISNNYCLSYINMLQMEVLKGEGSQLRNKNSVHTCTK